MWSLVGNQRKPNLWMAHLRIDRASSVSTSAKQVLSIHGISYPQVSHHLLGLEMPKANQNELSAIWSDRTNEQMKGSPNGSSSPYRGGLPSSPRMGWTKSDKNKNDMKHIIHNIMSPIPRGTFEFEPSHPAFFLSTFQGSQNYCRPPPLRKCLAPYTWPKHCPLQAVSPARLPGPSHEQKRFQWQ